MDQAHALESLRSVGIHQRAAEIYLSLLGKTKATISEIAQATGIKRATCYEYIDLLLKENFIERLPIGKRMYYSAVEPKKVLQSFKKRALLFEKTMSEMERVHDAAVNKPRVVFYEGKRADAQKNYGTFYKLWRG